MLRSHACAIAVGLSLGLTLPFQASSGEPEYPSREHNQYCVTGSEAAALSQAVQQWPDTISALASRSESVTLDERGAEYSVATPTGEVIASSHGSASEPRLLCANAQRPSAHGYSVPAQYASSLAAVSGFLQTHPWQGITTLHPGLQVNIWAYGRSYVIVQVSVGSATPNPGILDGCTWASYRITIATVKVYQFDSCGPPHNRGLPAFSELPPS